MKIRIDKNGFLFLERRGAMVKQYCPFCDNGVSACAETCPLLAVHLSEEKEEGAKRRGIVSLSCGRGTIITSDDIEIDGGVA